MGRIFLHKNITYLGRGGGGVEMKSKISEICYDDFC